MSSRNSNRGTGSLGEIFPEALRKFAEAAPSRKLNLQRGDIVWLEIQQTISSAGDPDHKSSKIRPFVILNETASCHVDADGKCTEPLTLLGISGTTQQHLVWGREHISLQLESGKTTYVMFDSLHTVNVLGQKIEVVSHLSEIQRELVRGGLDKILQPERKFFLKLIGNKLYPGQVWSISTAAGDATALILLKRGRLTTYRSPQDERDGLNPILETQRPKVPYLVMAFRKAQDLTSMRGIQWEDVDVMAVQEGAFISRKMVITEETVGILLNNLRRRVGLSPIAYRTPIIKSALNFSFWSQFPLNFLRL